MTISPEKMMEAYRALPPVIRSYVSSPKIGEDVNQVCAGRGLHIDVIGEIARSTTYILLGFISPADFLKELVSLGIPQTTAQSLISELNQKIFLPLQKKMRENPTGEDEYEENTVSGAVPVSTSSPKTTSSPAVLAPAALQSVPPVSAPVPVAAAPIQSVPAAPEFHTMAKDMELALHPEKAVAPAALIPTPSPSVGQSSPARSFQTASIPNTAPRPSVVTPPVPVPSRPVPTFPILPTTPVVSAPAPAAPSAPTAVPNIPPVPSPSAWKPAPATDAPQGSGPVLRPIVKQYGMDPYREAPE